MVPMRSSECCLRMRIAGGGGGGGDTWVWCNEPNGRFSIQLAYDLVSRPTNPRPEASWDLVWKWKGPCRIQFFLWLVAHEKLLTNLEWKRHHLSIDSCCPRCGNSEESVLHVIRDCPFASMAWDRLGVYRTNPIRIVTNVDQWLRSVLEHDRSMDFGVLCWYLWKARNEWIFTKNNHTLNSVAAKSISWTETIQSAMSCDKGGGGGGDTWVWCNEPNGRFSIQLAYDLVSRPTNPRPEASWDLVWKWKGPCRIQFFLWLVAHEKLLTNLEWKRHHLSIDSCCPRCGNSEESVLHVIRDCPFASMAWDRLGVYRTNPIRIVTNVDQWLRSVLEHDRSMDFGVLCWYLWKARNEWIFTKNNHTLNSVAAKSISWTETIQSAMSCDKGVGGIQPNRTHVDIGWEQGQTRSVVLNTDGSVLSHTNSAAAGGLVWNEFGRCLNAFSTNLGRCFITRAKL
ncbi:Putative ribonuclease H protein At1g65750 [Linum perenne]